ncbi:MULTISPECIES: peroxidase-related enzyme [Fischerella]|uniref:Alkylhydroperoxidase n=1 Tax=Fischerella muscicola CCMEE 5323 TaxID=2019572 RepID=A0A2N6K3L7_FISMU|nr:MULTISPECIES: peroxidase-related enzyme [Fischerella]MBD2433471.1 peroxidase-related enzyme [Fischerella sp. FACHB-380]PLZ90202.1 alkylhydroperoxidase [Fischerella muscicola CCMEE 5323]
MPKNSRKTKVLQHPTQVATKQNPVAVQEKKTVTNSWLEVPDEATLPPQVQALFQEQRDRYGFVHSFFLGYSLNPEHLLLWFNYYNALMYGKGELSPKEREIIAIVSSAANHCESCVITHKAHLREVIKDPVFPDALARNHQEVELTQRELALVEFAIKINQNANELSPEDLKPLRQVGLSDRAILEAGEIAAQFSLSNRLTKAFGWKVSSEYDKLYR